MCVCIACRDCRSGSDQEIRHTADAVGFDSLPPLAEVALDFVEPSLLLLHEDVGENYDAVARSAAAAVGAETCHLALYDPDTDELIARRPNYAAAARSIPQYRFAITLAPASAHVVRTGEAYLSNDPAHDGFSSARDSSSSARASK